MASVNASKKGKGSSIGRGHSAASCPGGSSDVVENVNSEIIVAERDALVAERQAKLERILDEHDTLVREAFHMEKFVTLLSYDPKIAKEDNSAVFREYQAKYDLMEKASSSSGPSRKTRRAQTERLSYLRGPSTSISSASSSKASSKKPAENKVIRNILSEAKGKGKNVTDDGESLSTPNSRKQVSAKAKGKTNLTNNDVYLDPLLDLPAPVALPTESISSGPARNHPKRSNVKDNIHLPSKINPSIPDTLSPPRKKRKVEPSSEGTNNILSQHGALPSDEHTPQPFSVPPHVNGNSRGPPIRASARLQGSQHHIEAIHPDPEANNELQQKPPIKRVKLIVRRPPPLLTHHRQRPPPAKHDYSLTAFLSSYTSLDGQDQTLEELEKQARHDAKIYERADVLRKKGQLLPTEYLDILSATPEPDNPIVDSKHNDPWSSIISGVVARYRRQTYGQQVAKQLNKMVKEYWDGVAAKEEKVRLQEEKRLRHMAKATIRMVTTEWKRVVFHIREEERLKLEAEEMRRGHEHLDAILDQSGRILENQQEDLTRGELLLPRSRSRSGSASAALGDWACVLGGPEDSGSEQGDDEDEDEDREEIEDTGQDSSENDWHNLDDATSEANEELPPAEQEDVESLHEEEEESDSGYDGVDSSALLLGALNDPSLAHTPGYEIDEDVEDLDAASSRLPVYRKSLDVSVDSSSSPLFPDTPATPYSPHSTGTPRDEHVRDPRVVDTEGDFVCESLPVSTSKTDLLIAEEKDQYATATPARSETPENDVTGAITQEGSPVQRALSDIGEDPQSATPQIPVATVDESEDIMQTPDDIEEEEPVIDEHLKPYAVAPVDWDPGAGVRPPLLLRGNLRPYQQTGLEWLASLHARNLNGILADEMGLGKTIQTISLLAHLACDRGIWGPHLIIVPTSVLLNWEMEFKKFLPGFKVLSYHGTTKRRKELRQGWNDKHHFNVCITSYTLASRDAHIFKRKAWYYMILDEAHMIKNFKSQRWNILLMFRSFRRLLLTGTPLQNNLTELWALLQFLMSGTNFVNLKEFGELFSNPLEKAIEMGAMLDDETSQRVSKLHLMLRPYLLRRLKRDVEKELPKKYEHLVLCSLSKRQRFLYDEFMSRAITRDALQSGVYQKIANVLMQLRKVCNHPDLFEVRPIVTSFAMERAAIADFEIKELLVRRRLLSTQDEDDLDLDTLGLRFISRENTSLITALESRRLDGTSLLPYISEMPGEPPPKDMRTIVGFKEYSAYQHRAATIARWTHIGYLNQLRCSCFPIYSQETIAIANRLNRPLVPLSALDLSRNYMEVPTVVPSIIKSYVTREQEMVNLIDTFAFVTPPVVACDMPRIALSGSDPLIREAIRDSSFDAVLHRATVKLQIAFPHPSLLQYDCGKLQELTRLLQEKKAGGHRVLIFTQMTKILDILEIFLNFHGYLYLRLDGATKIEDRQYITERFNADSRIFCFIASSRSGGVGINLTGADTVVFYDSDFNPQMDRQCEDRAHRIGQIRDVHIYRFISQHTVEEAMLRKANQKRSLDDMVIQKGEFDWRTLFRDEVALTQALGEFEDTEDAHAAAVAAREEVVMEGADEADFGGDAEREGLPPNIPNDVEESGSVEPEPEPEAERDPEEGEGGGTAVDYMLSFARFDYNFFKDWRL